MGAVAGLAVVPVVAASLSGRGVRYTPLPPHGKPVWRALCGRAWKRKHRAMPG